MTSSPPEDPGRATKPDGLDSLRRKLAKRQKAAEGAGASQSGPPGGEAWPVLPPPAIVYRRDLPREAPRRLAPHTGICIPLEQCVAGTEVRSTEGLSCYLIERALATSEPQATGLSAALARAVEALAPCGGPAVAPHEMCILDIETTGLGTAPIFLIGTLALRDGAMVCRQHLARTYAEEASILERFAAEVRSTPLFVTFNGKTFDVPSLRVRAAAAGVPFSEPQFHLDLLHEARRRFKDLVPDCRLQTLERRVCQRYRGYDIPASDIGRAYHDFVRSGDAREIAQIVEHNQWDLVTMAHLMARLFGPGA